jgi:hypothetical protein
MAVLIEAVSVVIRVETIEEKYPGGLEQYIKDSPNRTLCMDEDIVRLGFMDSNDAGEFIDSLVSLGFRYITDEEFDEIAVVDQFTGFYAPCEWLDFTDSAAFKGAKRISACKLKGAYVDYIYLPEKWVYEESLSKKTIVTDQDEDAVRMTFIRREGNFDIFRDKLTGEEVYRERTVRRNLN